MEGLQQMEDILRETPLWGDIARYMLLANDLIHSANLVLHEVIGEQAFCFFSFFGLCVILYVFLFLFLFFITSFLLHV